MNLTPDDLRPVVLALINLGKITVGDKNQPATWAAYLSAEVPLALPEDLGYATRAALKWHQERGSYGHLSAADYAAALHSIVAKRPQARCPIHTTEIAGMCLPCRQAKDPRILTEQGEPA